MDKLHVEINEKNKGYLLELIYDLFNIKINEVDFKQNLLEDKCPINITEIVILLDRIEQDKECAMYEFLQENDYSVLTLENILTRLNEKTFKTDVKHK